MKNKDKKSAKNQGTIIVNVTSVGGNPFKLDVTRKEIPGGIELKVDVTSPDESV